MSDCPLCPLEPLCHYPFKPTECVHLRKFWDEPRRQKWDREQREQQQSSRT